MFHQHLHTARHETLGRAGYSQAIQFLSPTINLICQIYFRRTYILARITQRAGRHIIIIVQRCFQHSQVNANRARNKIGIRISTGTTVHRTRIHASSAAQAVQRLHMLLIGQNITTSVIYDNDVQFTSFAGFAIM